MISLDNDYAYSSSLIQSVRQMNLLNFIDYLINYSLVVVALYDLCYYCYRMDYDCANVYKLFYANLV